MFEGDGATARGYSRSSEEETDCEVSEAVLSIFEAAKLVRNVVKRSSPSMGVFSSVRATLEPRTSLRLARGNPKIYSTYATKGNEKEINGDTDLARGNPKRKD